MTELKKPILARNGNFKGTELIRSVSFLMQMFDSERFFKYNRIGDNNECI